MADSNLLAKIASNPTIPTLPVIALQVLEKVGKPDCTIHQIGEIISRDPPMAGKILKLVNSALFGLTSPVASIDHALQLLGLKRVRALVLSFSLPALRSGAVPGERQQRFWKASVVGAMAASNLAAVTTFFDRDNAMVAGLLRDLGMLVLEQVFPKEYSQLLSDYGGEFPDNQCLRETDRFGLHHAELSSYLLHKWHLPEDVFLPVQHHHHPLDVEDDAELRRKSMLLYIADRIAEMEFTVVSKERLGEIVSLSEEHLSLDQPKLEECLRPLKGQITELADLLNLDLGSCHDYASLLENAEQQLSQWTIEVQMDNLRLAEEKQQVERQKRQTEAVLRQTEEQLRQAQKMESLGRLAGGIAHDFNNALTIINGYSELVLSQLAPNHTLRNLVEEIHAAGKRAAELTRQLLAFSRRQTLSPRAFQLNDTLISLRRMLAPIIGEGITLELDLPDDLPLVYADVAQIEHLLMNLCVNARDAMPDGGLLKVATCSVDLNPGDVENWPELQSGEYVVLTVSDTGHGMDSETMAQIFEPFFTTKPTGKGTGLGLATVYGIVKQSGGHITVESEVGRGTTFRVYLPVASAGARKERESTSSIDLPRGNETILVVDDETAVQNMVCEVLRSSGYSVIGVTHAVEALEVFREFDGRFDLLITDVVMPQINGCELARRVLRSNPRTKVLFISGYSDEATLGNGLKEMLADPAHYLPKPFSAKTLLYKVRELLDAPEV